jgi:hypothetical protein
MLMKAGINMVWSEICTIDKGPTISEISNYIDNPLWEELCCFIEKTYSVMPQIEYSKCLAARGWNVKYKKGSKSICTLYPNKNYFTCLVAVGVKQAAETELMLPSCDPYIQDLYKSTNPFNGARWLMIDVTTPNILDDVKKLIYIRIKPKK